MDKDTKKLAEMVLTWWEEAQYWEAYPGQNQFDDDPDFVTKAQEILPDFKVIK